MYGLDCEMCLTTIKKNELTRVSVINEKHEVSARSSFFHMFLRENAELIKRFTRRLFMIHW